MGRDRESNRSKQEPASDIMAEVGGVHESRAEARVEQVDRVNHMHPASET